MFEKYKASLERLEKLLIPKVFRYNNEDCFLTALVGAERTENYKTAQGYDYIAALNDTALEDWS